MRLTDVMPLDPSHDRKQFASGAASLDNWLLRNASKAAQADTARTYVICDEDGVVVGYYALCMHSLEDAAPVSSGPHAVPGVLLAKLAVDERYQRSGMGEELLLDAFVVAVKAANALGSKLLVVDALNEGAAEYYAKYGFKRFEADPLKLYLPMSDVRRTLEEAGLAGENILGL